MINMQDREPYVPVTRPGATLASELAEEGYQPGTTGVQIVFWALGCPIDADLCAIYECRCGHRGMDYRPFTRGDRYRAFAVCPACDVAYEF